jgi:hypothetical protein
MQIVRNYVLFRFDITLATPVVTLAHTHACIHTQRARTHVRTHKRTNARFLRTRTNTRAHAPTRAHTHRLPTPPHHAAERLHVQQRLQQVQQLAHGTPAELRISSAAIAAANNAVAPCTTTTTIAPEPRQQVREELGRDAECARNVALQHGLERILVAPPKHHGLRAMRAVSDAVVAAVVTPVVATTAIATAAVVVVVAVGPGMPSSASSPPPLPAVVRYKVWARMEVTELALLLGPRRKGIVVATTIATTSKATAAAAATTTITTTALVAGTPGVCAAACCCCRRVVLGRRLLQSMQHALDEVFKPGPWQMLRSAVRRWHSKR